MDLEYFKMRYKEEKRWLLQDGKTDLFWKVCSPFKIIWTLLWENTMGPLWQLKWWIIDDLFHSKMKRKLIISTLDRTWTDSDEVLLHATFQVLVNYYKDEKPREHHYFEYSDEVVDSLHTWWTTFRPQRIEPFDNQYFEGVNKPHGLFVGTKRKEYGEYWELLYLASAIEEKYLKEDTEKLMLLCEHRRCMWT